MKHQYDMAKKGKTKYSTKYNYFIDAKDHAFYFTLKHEKASNGEKNQRKTVFNPSNNCTLIYNNINSVNDSNKINMKTKYTNSINLVISNNYITFPPLARE